VDIYREIGSGEVVKALRNEASCWYDAKDYEKSLACYRKALAEPNPEGNDFHIGRDYYNCATTLIKLKKWQEALDNFLSA
jgi:tetratricopeptide (TPR) repeat protein